MLQEIMGGRDWGVMRVCLKDPLWERYPLQKIVKVFPKLSDRPGRKNLRNSSTSVVNLVSNVWITFTFLYVFVPKILCGTKI